MKCSGVDCVGYQELSPDQPTVPKWRSVIINTGASQSTLQDIKVPAYGGGYAYKGSSALSSNRYIFWRVTDDIIELWEECLSFDLVQNYVSLRIVGLPILEGVSAHESSGRHVRLLVATIASTHCFTLPHPDTLKLGESKGAPQPSILRDLEQNCLVDTHSMHLLSSPALEVGRIHACCSAVCGDRAVFLFGAPAAALLVISMDPNARHPPPPGAVDSTSVTLVKNNSLVNRLFLGFVPGVFKAGESGRVSSLCCVVLRNGKQQQAYGVGVCGDARLRLWCLQRSDCVIVRDTAEDTGETAAAGGGEGHRVVCRPMGDGSAVVAVWLSFVDRHLLLLYRLTSPGSSDAASAVPQLAHLRTLFPPQQRLVDLQLTDVDVWTLWTDTNSDSEVMHCPIELQQETDAVAGAGGLQAACAQPAPPKTVPLADPALDPKEVYLQTLFLPNTFSRSCLTRALAIYGRSGSDQTPQDAVEETLRQQLENSSPHDAGPQERYDLALDVWETFYNHVLEYHQVGRKSLGLVCGAEGEVAVVRRAGVSWVVAVEALEALVAAVIAAPPSEDLTQLVLRYGASAVLCGDASLAASVAGALRCVAIVHSLMNSEVAAAFVLDMAHHTHPEVVAEDVASSLLSQVVAGDEAAAVLSSAVSAVPNFTAGLRCVLHALKLDSNRAQDSADPARPSSQCQLWSSLVSASLHHLAQSRFQLCRDLLVLQQAVLQLSQLCHLSADCVGELRSSVVQETVLLCRAYYALLCLTRSPATRPSQQLLHDLTRALAALGLHDTVPSVEPLPQGALPSTALCAILQQGACRLQPQGPWITSVAKAVRDFAREAWPLQDRSGSTELLEALLFSGQGTAALHYIRQVSGWCEWSLCSRHFLLGVCLLLQGQHRKAARVLQEAAEGCASEELLATRVGGGGDTALLRYTLRLVRLFEVFQEPVLALRLASSALCVEQHSTGHMSQLYAVLFKHHLALGHYNEAFTALLSNPDPDAQRSCLRQLLTTLHNSGCLSTLVGYQYGHLTGDVVSILENRARSSSDILQNNYYHLLYAFHLHQHNYKRAASAMYECAMRLDSGGEAGSEEALKLQLKCYLACLNCLELLPPSEAWILKPNPLNTQPSPALDTTTKQTRRLIGSSAGASARRVKGAAAVEVLEVPQIGNEFEILHARLSLARMGTSCSIGISNVGDADSLISLLCHARLYKDAVKLCARLDRSLRPVVASLAGVCVAADQAADAQHNAAWLKHNDVTNVNGGWWDLLRELLEREKGNKSELHHTATAAILDLNHGLPPWLPLSYCRRDCGGLLKLLLRHGLLDASAQLVLRLMDALTLGRNAEEFGLSGAVHSNSPPVWVPYSALDQLLLELQANSHHSHYEQMLSVLQQRLDSYRNALARVSNDRLLLAA
ncbi:nuclear pore complex protein Nup160 isoform X2 [Hyalella azteca]|uniref:Nuclear pore complex protein Nup160 isoform X2 n=1 Tax=Hyalella azteca TaxID=294128 RepID=A0A8B7NS08_HYAAZ|nr:nuclear pore complex protein Nup160 isoform X2 [Hyalella azteca]